MTNNYTYNPLEYFPSHEIDLGNISPSTYNEAFYSGARQGLLILETENGHHEEFSVQIYRFRDDFNLSYFNNEYNYLKVTCEMNITNFAVKPVFDDETLMLIREADMTNYAKELERRIATDEKYIHDLKDEKKTLINIQDSIKASINNVCESAKKLNIELNDDYIIHEFSKLKTHPHTLINERK